MTDILPCPFCGSDIDPCDPDVIYPSGIWWRDQGDYRQYVGHQEKLVGDNPCFDIVCPGQCGCVLSGDSYSETIDNWNRRS
jgi:hypothetical protein